MRKMLLPPEVIKKLPIPKLFVKEDSSITKSEALKPKRVPDESSFHE